MLGSQLIFRREFHNLIGIEQFISTSFLVQVLVNNVVSLLGFIWFLSRKKPVEDAEDDESGSEDDSNTAGRQGSRKRSDDSVRRKIFTHNVQFYVNC